MAVFFFKVFYGYIFLRISYEINLEGDFSTTLNSLWQYTEGFWGKVSVSAVRAAEIPVTYKRNFLNLD